MRVFKLSTGIQNNNPLKQILIPIFLLNAIFSLAQNDPIPISQNGIWVMGGGHWDGFGNFVYTTPNGIMITDTINVNDTLYLQFSNFEFCDGGTLFSYAFLFREDSGKYFYRSDVLSAERLWFDFTLEVGESITLENCYDGEVEVEELSVVSIDNVTLGNGSQRKKWTLQHSNSPETEEWVEGIGNVHQGLEHPLAATCLDLGRWLRCYYENDEWVESFVYMPEGTDCCTVVGVQELDEVELMLFPNPATSQLHIVSSSVMSSIELSNSTGQNIFQSFPLSSEANVNLDHFSRGCYFVKTTLQNGYVVTRRFIIN